MEPSHKRSLLLVFFTAILSPSIAKDTITPTQPLLDDEILISSGENFTLGFFTPANTTNRYIGLWYNIPLQTIVWVANRNNPIVNNSTGTLSITPNGSLVITDQRNSTVWSTPATALASPVAQLLDNGNLVVKEEASTSTDASSFAWQGFDYPTDTILPGMRLGWNLTSRLSRNMTAWKSATDPSSGPYYSAMILSGDPELHFWSRSTMLWRTGPWVGKHFSGVPGSTTYQGFVFHFVNNAEEVTYSYEITNKSVITRLIVNYTGITERSFWIPETGEWNFFWYAPRDQCDNYNECGPFGKCDPSNSPICDCLQGFTPKNPTNWALRDGSDGCVRKTELDCKNGTDGFAVVKSAKLPETSNTSVDLSLGLYQCRALCLRNCSCTAYASADISGGGSGCVIWVGQLSDIRLYTNGTAGQDLYVRLAAADVEVTPGQSHKHGGHTTIAIVASLVVVILLACLGCLLWRRMRMRWELRATAHPFGEHNIHGRAQRENHDDLELPLFDIATIVAATENFSEVNKLGEGGFGPVYKGELGEGQDIAVKRLAKSSIQGLDEFKNEVMLIAKLQHRNLVRLLGCCIQAEERMLIYEYMPNKSLDVFLFDKEKATLLDWRTRYKIITGIARGLLYLHQDSRFRVIHRDLKTSNVLLDTEMNPKISDFGMARIFGGDETEVNTRRVVGTYGYMSPEYALDGIFSMKSDVFSFGVIVLEILSGKRSRAVYANSPNVNLAVHAWNLWNEGNGLQMVDELIDHTFAEDEVLKCMKVGLLCVQERPEDRPLMSSVILMLGNDSATSLPNPRQPGFVARRGPFEMNSSSSKPDSCSLNDITISMVQAR